MQDSAAAADSVRQADSLAAALRLAGTPAPRTRAAVPTGRVAQREVPAAAAPTSAQPPVAVPTAAQPPAASAKARITIGSTPATAQMIINGEPMVRNPIRDYEVPAGLVTVRFVVTDSTGVSWENVFHYTAQGGLLLYVGRVILRRP